MTRKSFLASLSLAFVSGIASAQAGLFISVADNIGTEINGFGPFVDHAAIQTDQAGSFATEFFAINSGDLDAFHILPNGNYLLSSLFNGTVGANAFQDGDLVEYNPTTGLVVGNYLGLGESSFTSSAADISSATTDQQGNLFFSALAASNTLTHAGGSLTFTSGDIVRLDATTGIASIFVPEADIFDDGDGSVYGLHWMGDGSFLMSSSADEAVSGNNFLDGDVFSYSFTQDTSSLFFSESNFSDTANSHDIDAIYFQVPAPAGVALAGIGAIFAARRRRGS